MFLFSKSWLETTASFHESQPLRDKNVLSLYRLVIYSSEEGHLTL